MVGGLLGAGLQDGEQGGEGAGEHLRYNDRSTHSQVLAKLKAIQRFVDRYPSAR